MNSWFKQSASPTSQLSHPGNIAGSLACSGTFLGNPDSPGQDEQPASQTVQRSYTVSEAAQTLQADSQTPSGTGQSSPAKPDQRIRHGQPVPLFSPLFFFLSLILSSSVEGHWQAIVSGSWPLKPSSKSCGTISMWCPPVPQWKTCFGISPKIISNLIFIIVAAVLWCFAIAWNINSLRCCWTSIGIGKGWLDSLTRIRSIPNYQFLRRVDLLSIEMLVAWWCWSGAFSVAQLVSATYWFVCASAIFQASWTMDKYNSILHLSRFCM